MNLLKDWGFSWDGLRSGTRGEYWVLAQGVLALGFILLPIYRLSEFKLPAGIEQYGLLLIALLLAIVSLILFFKGFWDLGNSLTPLPHPRDDSQLVQKGVYGIVRHPIYSGLILGGLGWALHQMSVTHLLGTIAIFLFFNAKASREEIWLKERYPDYSEYCQRVKKLIPGVY
jgi:protein-S-isoprenylcysteine O-methyltransferase Ste14